MKKVIIASLLLVLAATAVSAGYYRNKNLYTRSYTSTYKTNNMGTRKAPEGYHTDKYGNVRKNNPYM